MKGGNLFLRSLSGKMSVTFVCSFTCIYKSVCGWFSPKRTPRERERQESRRRFTTDEISRIKLCVSVCVTTTSANLYSRLCFTLSYICKVSFEIFCFTMKVFGSFELSSPHFIYKIQNFLLNFFFCYTGDEKNSRLGGYRVTTQRRDFISGVGIYTASSGFCSKCFITPPSSNIGQPATHTRCNFNLPNISP